MGLNQDMWVYRIADIRQFLYGLFLFKYYSPLFKEEEEYFRWGEKTRKYLFRVTLFALNKSALSLSLSSCSKTTIANPEVN